MTTTGVSDNFFGLGLLQEGDFYQPSSILHPVAIGSIAIIVLFFYLRISSNRTVAPLTIWDTIVNIALGSVSMAPCHELSSSSRYWFASCNGSTTSTQTTR